MRARARPAGDRKRKRTFPARRQRGIQCRLVGVPVATEHVISGHPIPFAHLGPHSLQRMRASEVIRMHMRFTYSGHLVSFPLQERRESLDTLLRDLARR